MQSHRIDRMRNSMECEGLFILINVKNKFILKEVMHDVVEHLKLHKFSFVRFVFYDMLN